jgi:hypothetical protein
MSTKRGSKKAYLVVNQSGEGKIIEEVGEEPPHVGISVFSQTFIVEAVNLSDLP